MRHLIKVFNRISIKAKLVVIMVFCVLLPMAVTDGFIIRSMLREVQEENQMEMENTAAAAQYIIEDYVNSAYVFMDNLAIQRGVTLFANEDHESDLEFYENYYTLSKNTAFADDRFRATIYSDSKGTISGGVFQRLASAQDREWYKKFKAYELFAKGKYLYIGVEDLKWKETRSMALISRMDVYDAFLNQVAEKIIRVDINYSRILQAIDSAKYSYTVYIACNGYVVCSNAADAQGGANFAFYKLPEDIVDRAGYMNSFSEYGTDFDVYVMPADNSVLRAIRENSLIISILLTLNVLIPVFATVLINRSFSERLYALAKLFESSSKDSLDTIDEIDGTDEISQLMNAYNGMAGRINTLIENEYKERLKRQEIDLARQRAELTALHAQINPHFLFNALESIRMHSFVKKETETARMVESLAVIQRQIVEWGNDSVQIKDEISFVEAYLELEKYRFGNRLMYEIAADDNTMQLKVPKLSLVTFVENACVHGMEKKTSACWIFVRVSKEEDFLVLEVEDTGNGFTEEMRRKLVEDIEGVNMELIRGRKSVGILNAALRLKMSTDNRVKFEIESESGVGTMISIKIPLDCTE